MEKAKNANENLTELVVATCSIFNGNRQNTNSHTCDSTETDIPSSHAKGKGVNAGVAKSPSLAHRMSDI